VLDTAMEGADFGGDDDDDDFLGAVFGMLTTLFMLFCFIACTELGKRLHKALFDAAQRNDVALTIYGITEAITPVILLIIAVAALAGASYNPFIYFQF